MFSDSVSFNGGTRVEVITVLANCGRDTDKARRALVTWIRHKQDKGRSTEHILVKLRDIESKFIKDKSLHDAFRDARAETFLPRAPDLPLPSSIRKKSQARRPESIPSPNSAGPSWNSSPSIELHMGSTQQTTPPISPLSLSRDSHQVSETLPGNPNTSRWISLPRGVFPQSRSPRIQIPRHRSLQPAPSSPITSSPEDSGLQVRYHHMSHPVGLSSQSSSQVSPSSTSPPKFPPSPISSRDLYSGRGLTRGLVLKNPPLSPETPRSRSQRGSPNSPRTSSSEESDFHPRYHRMTRGSMSPGRRRVTPPRTSPPDVPLPPIPSDDQDEESKSSIDRQTLTIEQPPTPVRCTVSPPSTPARPLPIQPVPSPVPSSNESGRTDAINGNSLRQHWQESNGELPSDDVVRQDSPVFVFNDDHACQTGVGAPPPYVDQFDTYSTSDMPTIGEALDKAVSVCGGSLDVRLEVSKCIGFHRGYEPPYWQTRLQACGLNAEAASYLVREMTQHVDWTASFGRAF